MAAANAKPYLERIVDLELDELTAGLAAVVLEGPKGVGKTVTASRRAGTVHQLDDPAQRNIALADPGTSAGWGSAGADR